MFSDADAVEQQGTLCFASPYRDFLKVANLFFELGWKVMDQGPEVDGHGHDNKREEEGWFPTFRTTFIHCQGFILHLILFNSMFLKYKMCNQVIFTYKLRKEGYKN